MPNAAATMPRRFRQVAATAGLIVFAIAALLSGTDRQSREFPNSPSVIGWPYDTGAARARAISAFVQSGPQSAIGFARRAILSDPISALPISLLGRSQLYAGQLQEAHKTFEIAGQMGWRDGMTQIYWLDQALLAGDVKVASERLDALLRQAPGEENRDKFIAFVAATPEGRSAMAERLKLAPPWAQTIVTTLADVPVDQLLLRLDIMQRTGKGVWDCPATQTMTQQFIKLEMFEQAQVAWRLNCDSSGSLVYDGGFSHLDLLKSASAFDWRISNRGDADIVLTSDPSGNPSLALEVTAPVTLPIIQQLVILKPGRYRLMWKTPNTAPAKSRALQVSLDCAANLGRAVGGTAVTGKPGVWMQDFTVDRACQAQRLVFWLAPRTPIHLDDVMLNALDGPESKEGSLLNQ